MKSNQVFQEAVADLNASSLVSGSLLPRVSGKAAAMPPAAVARQPMMITGAGGQNTFRESRSRAAIPPSLATREHVPTAWFLEGEVVMRSGGRGLI